MSRDLQDLSATAARGTSRAELPAPSGALAPALSSVPGNTPEARLLGRAALLGLYARAGSPLQKAAAPPPIPLPAAERSLPSALAALLPTLIRTDPVLAAQALDTVAARDWTLNAAQVLALYRRDTNLARALWRLSDARARATLGTHPLRAQAQKAEEFAAWQARLEALSELRRRAPEEAAQEVQELWVTQPAERRRDLLALVRRDLRLEDRPLLEAATRDRSPELQKQVRQLLGHLPGPLQDELLALLPQAVKVSGLLKKKITFGAFNLPAALGKPRAGQYDDGDLHRLLGALPTELVLKTLGLGWNELHKAAHAHHWSLANELREPSPPAPEPLDPVTARARIRDLAGQPRVSSEKLLAAVQALGPFPDLSSEAQALQSALATRTLDLFGREGPNWQARELALLLGRHLSPDLTVPPPTPLPFELPPRPKQLPSWQTPANWEERQRQDHAGREQAAFRAWRELQGTLRVRRDWRGALAAHSTL
ncbi:DUF5691 domain-containing protein [Deinococcus hopiensis]|uniref:Uncharacterized protein n=1 Tax=Deinococcus hopiensis KR-140 TaxID=695939 RepID=A0A1W1UEZ4_9DEIO|nr:DUF5691 domain-containing protein [Deinococcus hopiensis]SMB79354.1 hypothetical protein SAMN00790413_05896 [Deinococcus hopiensis KR-140]